MSFYPGPYQSGYMPYMAQPAKVPKPEVSLSFDAIAFMIVLVVSLIGIIPIGIMRATERRARRFDPDRDQLPDRPFESKEELARWIKLHLGYDVLDSQLEILMAVHGNRKVLIANSRANGKRTLQEISDAIAARRRKARR